MVMEKREGNMKDLLECDRITRIGKLIAYFTTIAILVGAVLWFGGRLVLGLIVAATWCGLSC